MWHVQVLACDFPGSVVALDLSATNLNGRLPSRLARLPLHVLALQDNPHLLGSIPSDMATHDLVSLHITGTRLNCHNSVLTRAEQAAATRDLLPLHSPATDTSQLPEARAERACLQDASHVYDGPFPLRVMVVPRFRGSKGCAAPWLQGSHAILTERYILSIGCLCKSSLQPEPVRQALDEGGGYTCRAVLGTRCDVNSLFGFYKHTRCQVLHWQLQLLCRLMTQCCPLEQELH